MLFLFATFPNIKVVNERILNQCRRLTVEFMHFVIHTQALRKVFVSIKGWRTFYGDYVVNEF